MGKMIFRKSPDQSYHPHIDYCNICNKKLVGRGTKYKDPDRTGYLCRQHAKERGIRVFRPIHGWVPIKSKEL